MITILTVRFLPFFLILWIVSECCLSWNQWRLPDIPALQSMYHPPSTRYICFRVFSDIATLHHFTICHERFWVSASIQRTRVSSFSIVDSRVHAKRLVVGLNFGVQIAWIVASLCTISISQWFVSRRDRRKWETQDENEKPNRDVWTLDFWRFADSYINESRSTFVVNVNYLSLLNIPTGHHKGSASLRWSHHFWTNLVILLLSCPKSSRARIPSGLRTLHTPKSEADIWKPRHRVTRHLLC